MDYLVIDAHAHLWLKQDTKVEDLPIRTTYNGRSFFMKEEVQMLPPFMIDGKNSAEVFLSNMDYAQVSAAIITQEYIDGDQNEYLEKIQQKYPDRFFCCGLVDARFPGYALKAEELIKRGFKAIKVPAQRLITSDKRIFLTCNEMMQMLDNMEKNDIILSIDLAEGNIQTDEMKEIIKEFPSLKIAIGHFGMVNRKGWKDQMKLALNENVMIESGGITWLFHDEFYPYNGAVRAIRESIDIVGSHKLMWGSDYPRTITAITYKMSYDFVEKSHLLNNEEKQLFLGRNAIKFYNLKNIVKPVYIKNMCE